MDHDEARAKLSLMQIEAEAVADNVTDEILASQMYDIAEAVNSAIARVDTLLTGHGTDLLKKPRNL